MASIKSFEEIIAWQKARELAKDVWNMTLLMPFSKDFSLCDQINRSSGSVMDNIAEGFERGGNKEFIQFLFIAKASLAEVKSQLYRASDRKHIDEKLLKKKQTIINELANIIGGLINYLKKSEIKGIKFIKENNSKL